MREPMTDDDYYVSDHAGQLFLNARGHAVAVTGASITLRPHRDTHRLAARTAARILRALFRPGTLHEA